MVAHRFIEPPGVIEICDVANDWALKWWNWTGWAIFNGRLQLGSVHVFNISSIESLHICMSATSSDKGLGAPGPVS